MKKGYLSILINGLLKENPVFVLVLGTCPTLAMTDSATKALGMGLAAAVVLICSNIAISALRKIIPDTVRIPSYIVIIAGFVTLMQLLLQAFLPDVYDMLGVYLALIVVNCIILGRAEMFARKNPVLDSALDGIGMGIGFLFALLLMATIREVLGAGSFWGFSIPVVRELKIPILTQAPGGYLVFGLLIALMNRLTEKRGGVKKKSFSCEGCPSNGTCSGKCQETEAKEGDA
jgi:electron transport complex protein RnfE